MITAILHFLCPGNGTLPAELRRTGTDDHVRGITAGGEGLKLA